MAALAAGAADSVPAFRTDVLPILTKAGCNAGACHGAATGQGGFRLSLLGYDPDEDYLRITREFEGRRVDLAHPEESLILRKPSGQVDHDGGRRLRQDSEGYRRVRQWVASGAGLGPRDLRVMGITVEPRDRLLDDTNLTVQLRVVATLSDGSQREVTPLALYSSNDDAIAEVTKTGLVTTVGRGPTSIAVRYAGQVDAARISVPYGREPVVLSDFAAGSYVDRQVGAELERLRVPASPLCDDGAFLRRLHLDLIGRLPTPEAARAFLAESPSTEKRRRVVEELLASPEFVDLWTLHLADLLLLNGKGETAKVYYQWLHDQVAAHAPYDQIARELLTATGDPTKNGPAGFFALARDPRDLAEHVGRMFLGARIGCARCHAHPSDRWTQEDYHRFAAFLARVSLDGGVVRVADRGEVDDPKTGRPLTPKPLGAPPQGQESTSDDRRLELAAWVTAPDNPLFARAFVNRVWRHLMGRGLIEPVDDLRPTNPPTHPRLLEDLANDFVVHGFDLRQLVRVIVTSRTYQLSSLAWKSNRADSRLYSHALMKSLPAAVFADGVAQVTGVPDVYPGYPEGTRAVQLASPATPSPALDLLGRCGRTQACDESTSGGGGLAQALHLINGSTINDKLPGRVLDKVKGLADDQVVEELYLSAFTRLPTEAEQTEWATLLARAHRRSEAIEDLLWALLNSREFALNH